MSMERDLMQDSTLYSGLQTFADLLEHITDLLLHYPDLQHGSTKRKSIHHLICTMASPWLATSGHLYIPYTVSNSLENRIMLLAPSVFQGIWNPVEQDLTLWSLIFLQKAGHPLDPVGSKGISCSAVQKQVLSELSQHWDFFCLHYQVIKQ